MLRKELDIHFSGDLLHHYPFRYNDRTQLNKIGSISTDGEYVQLIGTLINIFEEGVYAPPEGITLPVMSNTFFGLNVSGMIAL